MAHGFGKRHNASNYHGNFVLRICWLSDIQFPFHVQAHIGFAIWVLEKDHTGKTIPFLQRRGS
jgi:hypothetical protein